MRWVKTNSFISAVYEFAYTYFGPLNFTYFFNFGLLALVCLVMQIVTGLFLAMYYDPDFNNAFASVEYMVRNVPFGALLRYTHANGASMFFIVVYIHMFKAIYNGSYFKPRHLVWIVGVFILLVMIITAFFGYVLPWGQMSLWAATVITNFMTAIPYVGGDVVRWFWGGYSVSGPTLHRIYSLHFLLPFIIALLVVIHLLLLHTWGSSNPSGINLKLNMGSFTPYYMVKDAIGLVLFYMFASMFIFFAPNYLGHPDNYIPANPLVTPPHIVPEWYFLPFYAILRSIPGKLLGVLALVASILVLTLLPYIIDQRVRSAQYRPQYQMLVWIFIALCLILGYIGGRPIEFPYYDLGQCFTVMYFSYVLGIMPYLSEVDFRDIVHSARKFVTALK